MVEWSLGNLAAWSVQAAAIVAAGAWLPTRLRLGVPRARLLGFRLLLVACVALPVAQPWKPGAPPAEPTPTLEARSAVPDVEAQPLAGGTPSATGPVLPAAAPMPLAVAARVRDWAASVPWPTLVLAVLAAGTLTRLAWLGLGLLSLARLRRSSTPITLHTESIDDAVRAVGTAAAFRESPRVPRPVTFGLRAPVVIVPPGFTSLEAAQQRAVACHELLHVKRQDWLRTFGDEVVRSLLWFHPGIWWLVEQIHLSAEQTIDREVVALVGDRRSYLRALLALAESGAGPRLQPAASFLDHGHLRQRVAMLMEEASMSRARLVASVVFVVAVLAAGGWWSVSAFPLRGAAAPVVAGPETAPPTLVAMPMGGGATATAPVATGQAPPPPPPPAPPAPPAPPQQATRPGVPVPPGTAMPDEATLKRNIELNPKDLTNYFVLGRVYENAGDLTKAAAIYEAAIKAVPGDQKPYMQATGFYNRTGSFEKAVETLRRLAAADPGNPIHLYTMSTYYWEKAYRDTSLSEGQKRTYIDQGLAAVDRALAMNPDYAEALTYKNLLLRSQALLETDPAAQKTLIDEADRLRNRAIEIRKSRQNAGAPIETYPAPKVTAGSGGTVYAAAPPPPPPPPPSYANQLTFVESQLSKASLLLSELERRYSPQHPDVVRMKKNVADLTAKKQQLEVLAAKVVAGAPVPPGAPPPPPGKVIAGAPVPPDAPPPPPPPVGPDGTMAPVRVGGNIKPPMKIVDVKAVLPDEARAARVQGVVIVEATIGEDGKIRDAKVLRSIPMLDQAALDAVRQWEFTQTLLNGVPVPVIMTVTVNFTLE